MFRILDFNMYFVKFQIFKKSIYFEKSTELPVSFWTSLWPAKMNPLKFTNSSSQLTVHSSGKSFRTPNKIRVISTSVAWPTRTSCPS